MKIEHRDTDARHEVFLERGYTQVLKKQKTSPAIHEYSVVLLFVSKQVHVGIIQILF